MRTKWRHGYTRRSARGSAGRWRPFPEEPVPELPEVETLRLDLDKEVGGRKVKAVEVRAAKVVRRHRNRKEFTQRL
ncbi:MAG TPA: DNA-formamidopyrimidine glycosylase family protein, partial [Actinomycetes bacterium]|nr:DNA-formamidopyrimidine glycosylase family protein [Actinomycetes bacterium]